MVMNVFSVSDKTTSFSLLLLIFNNKKPNNDKIVLISLIFFAKTEILIEFMLLGPIFENKQLLRAKIITGNYAV